MKPPRPGSRKSSVFTAWREGGLPAAEKTGADLGLKGASVHAWIGSWQKWSKIDTSDIPEVGKTWFEKAKLVKPQKQYDKDEPSGKVWLTYDKESKGRIVRHGPEVSEIKFDNGSTRYIPNYHIGGRRSATT